jgi:urease accessory protein
LLQHGDSQFPGGGFAFSGGLEGLLADGRIAPGALEEVIAGMLRCRWAPFDRVAVRLAWQAHGAAPALAALDMQLEAALLAPAERTGSRRAGRAMIATHLRLGTPGAAELGAAIDAGALAGHRAVVEGTLWRALGLGEVEAALLSGYGFVNALGTACVRLGHTGALTQQRTLARLLPEVARLAEDPLPDDRLPRAFNPMAEIAIMRHPARDRTLFAT